MDSSDFFKQVSLNEIDGHDSLLQTGFWGEVKSIFGWIPFAFLYNQLPLLVLVRKIGPGISLAYIPHGPGYRMEERFLAVLAENLRKNLPPETLFIRFDIPWGVSGAGAVPPKFKSPFKKSTVDIQPPNTVILDLTLSEEEILKAMKSKTRYNIRLSEKKGVEISEGTIWKNSGEESGEDDLSLWYNLYCETAVRDKITIHSEKYYRELFKTAEKRKEKGKGSGPVIKLLLARFKGDLIAGNIVAIQGKTATYLYGASSNRNRNLMPTYGLQWAAVKLAKEAGCMEYDLFGIPPADDPSHPMHGLYRMKTGFGGRILNRPGCWDYPLKPVIYRFYRLAEQLRNYYYKKFRK